MDLKSLIDIQLKERYKHFIIHGPALSGKTELAIKVAKEFDGKYFSLLESLIQEADLKSNIDLFGPTKLLEFIKGKSESERLVIVDQIDFLINTWSEGQVRELMTFIDMNQSEVCYIFVMQTLRLLEKENLINLSDKGSQRVFSLFNQRGEIDG